MFTGNVNVERLESLKIILQGNAEFEATHAVLQGDHTFEVPDGYRMHIVSHESDSRCSLLDLIRNASSDLLSRGNIDIPQFEDNSKYLNSGPPFIILLHPALGPFWEVARQKI